MYNILSIGRANVFVMPSLEGETYPTCRCGYNLPYHFLGLPTFGHVWSKQCDGSLIFLITTNFGFFYKNNLKNHGTLEFYKIQNKRTTSFLGGHLMFQKLKNMAVYETVYLNFL
jgi:hypothetical protein